MANNFEAMYRCKNCGDVMLDLDRTEEERAIPTSMNTQYHLCVSNGNFNEWGILEHIGFYEKVEYVENTD